MPCSSAVSSSSASTRPSRGEVALGVVSAGRRVAVRRRPTFGDRLELARPGRPAHRPRRRRRSRARGDRHHEVDATDHEEDSGQHGEQAPHARQSARTAGRLQTFNNVYNLCATPSTPSWSTPWTFVNPTHFSRAYDEHHRAVYAAAHRVLDDHALAGDVVQDVFLRLWRRPAVLRRRARRPRHLPAPDGALARGRPVARGPVARSRDGPAQARRRPTTPGPPTARTRRSSAARPLRRARRPARAARVAARGARARLLGRHDRRADRPPRAHPARARPRAASASGSRSCAARSRRWRRRPRRGLGPGRTPLGPRALSRFHDVPP